MKCHKSSNNVFGFKAYFASFACAIFVIAFWISIDIVSNYYKEKTVLESVKQAIYGQDYQLAKELTLKRIDNSFFSNKAKKYFSSYPQTRKEITPQIVNDVFTIFTLLQEDNFNDSLKNIYSIKTRLNISNSSNNDNNDNNEKSSKLFNNIENTLQILFFETSNLKKYSEMLHDENVNGAQIKKRHTLLADEFATFLSLNPNYSEGTELDVYQDGILSGLPILKDLKDNISGFEDLKNEIEKINAKTNVLIDGENQAFTTKILSLREISNLTRKEFDEHKKNTQSLENEIENSKTIIQNNKIEIKKLMNELIIELNS